MQLVFSPDVKDCDCAISIRKLRSPKRAGLVRSRRVLNNLPPSAHHILFGFRQGEDIGLPGLHVQVKAARCQIVAIPVIAGVGKLILESPLRAGQVREGEADMTLALIGGIIHGDYQSLTIFALPCEGQETIVSPIAVPAGRTFKQLPLAVTNNWLT